MASGPCRMEWATYPIFGRTWLCFVSFCFVNVTNFEFTLYIQLYFRVALLAPASGPLFTTGIGIHTDNRLRFIQVQ